MPCQSYDDSWDRGNDSRKIAELKKQCDMLARIACKALTELEKNEVEDMLLLGDDEVRNWWKKHKEDDAREQARKAEIERKERIKAEALASLSDEAKELLGLSKPKKKSYKKVIKEEEDYEDAEEYTEWIEEDIEALEEQLEAAYQKLSNGTIIKTYKTK